MKKLWTILRRLLLLLIVLLLVIVVGVALFVRTERFRSLAQEQLVSTLNQSLRGEFSLGGIEGSVWNSLTLRDVVLTYQDTEVLHIPQITARYNLVSLLRGHFQIADVQVTSPTARFIQDAQGNWTLLEALASRTPEEPSDTTSGGLAILLETLGLANGHVEVTLAGAPPRHYQLNDTNLQTRIVIKSAGTEVQVRQLTTQLQGPELPPARIGATLTYQDATQPATVQIGNLTLDTSESHLRLAGEINNLATLDTNAKLTIEKLATGEIKQVLPAWPLTQDLSGTLQCQGPLSDLHAQLALAAADAQVSGDIRSNLQLDPFTYDGTVTIKGFNVEKQLARQDLAGVIDGTIQASGKGTEIQTVDSKADVTIRSLAVSRWQLGNITLSGGLAQQRGTISGKLASTFGQATWQGTIDLSSARPHYQLNLDMAHLDIKKTPTDMEPIASDLNLAAVVSGQGFAFPEVEAQAEVNVRPSTIGQVALDRGKLAARLTKDRVEIAEFTLQAKDTTVAVHGNLGTTTAASGQLTYALNVGNVSPWLALVDQTGSGELRVNGTAAGTLTALTLQGKVQAKNLRVATAAVQDGTLTYQLENVGQPHPSGTIVAALQNLEAGAPLKKIDTTIVLPKNQPPAEPPKAEVALSVQDAAARTHRLQGTVSYHAPRMTARLTELALTAPDGLWTLVQPTQVAQENNRIVIDRLLMANGTQQLQLSGQGGLSGTQDLQLHVDRLSLASLMTRQPHPPDVEGFLTVDVQVQGTAAQPRLTSTLDVAGLRIAKQKYAGLSAALGYDNQRATVDMTFNQDATHSLKANGTLPLTLSWEESVRTEVQGDLALQTHSAGLNLAFLNAFTGQAVKDIAGEFGLDLTVTGPVTKPRPQGSFALNKGQATLTALGVHLDNLTIQGQIDPETVRIVQLSARSGDGKLSGNGSLALHDYLPQQVSLSLSADRWPAIHTRQYQVEVDGDIEGRGPLSAPAITGKLRVPEAILRPDLEFLTAQPVKRDPTIIVLAADRPTAQPSTTATTPQPAMASQSSSQTADNLVLDMTIRLPRNTWIKHQDADIELAGKVNVTKPAGGKPGLVGTINIVRGWLNLQGRRFTLKQGLITFTGGETINPQLDIVAQYQLPQYVVEAVVGGSLDKPALTLRSEPSLEQADILALLLFGKPVSQLGQGEKTDFQQQALQMTGGYVAAQIADSVSQALGLEDLGLDMRQVDLTGGRVGFGRYISPKTYVSASQDISGKTGHQVTVDYYLSPRWTITTSSTTGGDNAAGIKWEMLY
jgi:translocation and assembly module TamB